MDLIDSAAVVFGGGSGLGAAAARRLAAHGVTVTVADLSAERAQSVASDIDGHAVAVDVRDMPAVRAAVAEAASRRPLRATVCCAGVGTPKKLLGRSGPAPDEHFELLIGVNLLGTINVLRAGAEVMSAQEPDAEGERGVCINTASIAAYDGQIGQVAYAASKGGVVGLTLPAARELAGHAIRVVTIAPGLFDTPMMAGLPEDVRTSLGASVPFPSRLGAPDEYGLLVAQILENPMLNGETIRLDGALRMAPR
jgi:3-hydroxyacyl-CoA dehydrogenase/3-hydroxy-2-methylbutyryl-CoA dehydrogenase